MIFPVFHNWYTAYPGSSSYSWRQALWGRGSGVTPEIDPKYEDPAVWRYSRISALSTFAQYSHKHSRYLCEVNGSTVWGRCRLKTLKLTLGPYVSAYFSYVVRRDDCRTFLDCTLPFWMDVLRASGRSLLMSRSFKNVTISFAISSGTVSFLGFL